jgi:hypothetical protein
MYAGEIGGPLNQVSWDVYQRSSEEHQEKSWSQAVVAHTCQSRYLRGWNWEDNCFRPAWAKHFVTHYL